MKIAQESGPDAAGARPRSAASGTIRDLVAGRFREGVFAFLCCLSLIVVASAATALGAPPLVISAASLLAPPFAAWALHAALRRMVGA